MAIIMNTLLLLCSLTIAFSEQQSDHNAIIKLQKQMQQMQGLYKKEHQQKDRQILELKAEIGNLKELKVEIEHLKELKAGIEPLKELKAETAHLKENIARLEAERESI